MTTNYDHGTTPTTSKVETQAQKPRKGRALTLDEVLALEAT
ncbi:MAG: hypothetical protein ACW99U_18470 [Candidatus Thorarchaeota archaeon]